MTTSVSLGLSKISAGMGAEFENGFEVEVEARENEQGVRAIETVVYPGGMNAAGVVGVALLLLAGPVFMVLFTVAPVGMALMIAVLMLVAGIVVRRAHPSISRQNAAIRESMPSLGDASVSD